MELLTIEHRDFTMSIECSKFDAIWDKAVRNVGEENLTSTYSWSDGVVSVVRQDEDGNEQSISHGEVAPAVFFDNAEYPIWVEFGNHVRSARFGSILQNDNENFSFRKGILAGFINYGNDIGKSEILIDYKVLKRELNEVLNLLDHHDINELPEFKGESPSSEMIAAFIYTKLKEKIVQLNKISVWETQTSCASYYEEND